MLDPGQAAYLESIGHEHAASRSKPISPTGSSTSAGALSSTPHSPSLSRWDEPACRPGVALSLSVSTEHLSASVEQTRAIRARASVHASRSSLALSAALPPPDCPLPPLPDLETAPPSPPESLESVIDANVLGRFSGQRYHPGTGLAPARSSSLTSLHERILSRSRDLLGLSVASIWTLSAEDGGKAMPARAHDVRGSQSYAEDAGTVISLDGISLSPSMVDRKGDAEYEPDQEEEDLLSPSPTDPSRPSLSTTSSSDTTETMAAGLGGGEERVLHRFSSSSVFDREPNLKLLRVTGGTSSPSSRRHGSPSISPRTRPLETFERTHDVSHCGEIDTSRDGPSLHKRAQRGIVQGREREGRQGIIDDDEDDEEDGRCDLFLRRTPGAFCWTPTERLTLTETDRDRLADVMRLKSTPSTSSARRHVPHGDIVDAS